MDALTLIGLLAAATAAKQVGNYQSQKAQNRQIWAGLERESSLRKQGEDKTLDFAQENFDANTRLKNYQAGIDANTEKFAAAANVPTQDATGQGDAYKRAQAQATAESAQKARTFAAQLARQGGFQALAQKDKFASTDLGADMLGINSDIQRNRRISDIRTRQAANKGWGWNLAGDLIGAGAAAYGGALGTAGAAGTQYVKGAPVRL